MNTASIYALLSVFVVSLVSFVGILTLSLHSRFGKSMMHFIVSFAAGALLGDVFIHLLPEVAAEGKFTAQLSWVILATIVIFFLTEKLIHWHHHHDETEESKQTHHPVALLNLVGDGLHNMIDGLIIGGAYLVDWKPGLATTVAVVLHEIPQEIGDFGVLIYAGLSRRRALFYNFLSGLTAMVGVIIALTLKNTENIATILVAIGIGSFLYISVADLIPEIHKTRDKIWVAFIAILSGIGVMAALLLLE